MHSLDEALRSSVMILQRIEKGDLKCEIGCLPRRLGVSRHILSYLTTNMMPVSNMVTKAASYSALFLRANCCFKEKS